MPFFSFGGKGSHKYHCRVLLLDDNEFTQEITSKTTGFDLMEKVFSNLNLYEKDYFGLRFRDIDDKTQWLDPDKTIKKQIDSGPPYTLYFGVKFYAADPAKLKEELTRYQFFLQIKKDMLQGRLPCSFNVSAELCAYAAQSELGDYDDSLHTINYVSEFRFVPNQNEVLEQKISEIHPKLRGQVPSEAEGSFLERVKWLEMYGVDLHPVRGQDNLEYFLGLTPTGIVLFRNRNKIGSFIWPKITKLKFKGHNFILRVNQGKNDDEKEYSFMLESKSAAKRLWKYCAEHHTFFRLEKANDVPASAYNFLFKKGSGFRFSGRTQQELLEDSTRMKRPAPAVQRVQSKRYARRASADESMSPMRQHFQDRVSSSQKNIARTPESNGGITTTYYSVDGKETSPPWQQRPNTQSGLYTSGHNISASPLNESAPAGVPVSARFPKPYKTTSALQSDGEMQKRKVSSYHAGYSSGEDIAARRKRSMFYSGYTSGASDGDAVVNKMKHRTGSEPNMAYSRSHGGGHGSNNREMVQQQDSFHRHRHDSRESVAMSAHEGRGGRDYRYYPRESGSKSDSEQNSRQRRQHNYYRAHRSRNGLSDTEMVPALDIYRPSDGSQVVQNDNRANRPKHHHHKHHHHKPRGAPVYDPRNAKVLLELGPETAAPESENSVTGDSTISSIPEERKATYQSQPGNLNQSNISNQSNQMVRMNHANHGNHANLVNHARVPMSEVNHNNHTRVPNPAQEYQRNHPQQRQQRPASMDMKYVSAGYHYVEHGPRPPTSAPGNRQQQPADPVRMKMAGQYANQHHHHPYSWQMATGGKNGQMPMKVSSEYLQQYMPPHVVSKASQQGKSDGVNNNRSQLVEQVVGPPSKPEISPAGKDIESELANYSISTEL